MLATGCLLDDPYYIEDSPLTEPARPNSTPREAGPGGARDPSQQPGGKEPEPDPVVSNLPSGDDDIIVSMPTVLEPGVTVPEPEPVLVDPEAMPEPAAVATPPEPEPVGASPEPEPDEPSVDAGTPEPGDGPQPEPMPTVGPDPEPCAPGSPGCEPSAVCGDGVAEADEVCDGKDLGPETCASQGFSGGTLRCTAECELDTSDCLDGPTCEAETTSSTGLVYEGDLNGQRNNIRSYSCSVGGRDSQDVTLTWTAPSSGCFEIAVDSPEAIDTIIAVYEDCSVKTELACDNEHNSLDPDSILQFEALANTTYALAVDAYEPGDQALIQVTISECESVWTCGAGRYDDGQTCDCGCGAPDPDCDNETAAACDKCGGPGSCSAPDCLLIRDEQNWLCGFGGPFGR